MRPRPVSSSQTHLGSAPVPCPATEPDGFHVHSAFCAAGDATLNARPR